MRIFKYTLILLCSLLFFWACGDDDDPVTEPSIEASISATPTSYPFEADGGTTKMEITSNTVWKIDFPADSWVKPSIQTAKGNASVTITAEANDAEEPRSATFILSAIGAENITITLTQAAKTPDPVIPDYIDPDKTGMDSDAPALAAKMKIGWNLGNSLEATDGTSAGETTWGNAKTSKKLIDGVKAAGFNTVRIPCAWNAYIEDQTTYKIKDSWLARVKEVVDYCVDNNMYAIINIHWDGGWLEENPTYNKQEEVNKKQKALWKQIAIYFRDYDEHLLFAGTNEVHAGYGTPTAENIEVQLSYNQTFIDAVRATGGRNAWRNLVVQAYNTNIDLAVSSLKMSTDATVNRMMAEVHYYDPYEFCLREDNSVFLWGKDFTGTGTASWGQEDWADSQFAKMKTNFVDKGIPIILGEYAATLRASLPAADYANHIKARNYYLNYITKAALLNGMVPVYWDSGITGDKASGLFDRATGEQVHTDAISAIIDAGN